MTGAVFYVDSACGCVVCLHMNWGFGVKIEEINQAKGRKKAKRESNSQAEMELLLNLQLTETMSLKLWNIRAFILKVHIIPSFCYSVKYRTSHIAELFLLLYS